MVRSELWLGEFWRGRLAGECVCGLIGGGLQLVSVSVVCLAGRRLSVGPAGAFVGKNGADCGVRGRRMSVFVA